MNAMGLEMLVQPGPDGSILLMPAWPHEWNVSFKLHAPGKTTIECDYRDGDVKSLIVTALLVVRKVAQRNSDIQRSRQGNVRTW